MKDTIRLLLFSLLILCCPLWLFAAGSDPVPSGGPARLWTSYEAAMLAMAMFVIGAVGTYMALRVRLRNRSRELLTVLAELRRKNKELEAEVEEREQVEKDKERLIQELKEALENLRKLRGLLPICAYCKKIRDDQGYWNQLESYIAQHADVTFTHSVCPECAKKIYEELQAYKDAEAKKKAATA
ncbi:hypothetical protein SAMN02746041_02046 [Desulfacinum hydrothermale DSM 13146]|uniref:Uncharacterized protein n=1 Tax=Desulfacinum hydrothermale DSM 13146 TaxID=1121390 RepID=A0A1W1XKS5_9BACT|nr:hypothetical protein [Desulfacinum hydrothermale]SMC24566.1 hypothetical protein SAMN02746041_02046 [Desulfacinum hydrothermale DSM 13146]